MFSVGRPIQCAYHLSSLLVGCLADVYFKRVTLLVYCIPVNVIENVPAHVCVNILLTPSCFLIDCNFQLEKDTAFIVQAIIKANWMFSVCSICYPDFFRLMVLLSVFTSLPTPPSSPKKKCPLSRHLSASRVVDRLDLGYVTFISRSMVLHANYICVYIGLSHRPL